MKQNYTHITFLLDRSGSMGIIKEDMEGGFNTFIEEQKKVPGECTVSLYQFDSNIFDTKDWYECKFEKIPLQDVPLLNLVPRGTTALYDAIGRCLFDTGKMLSDMSEDDRPGKVLFVIITDGMENASKEYSADRIKELVEHQEQVYNWEVVFLGANMDAIIEGGKIGTQSYKSMTFNADSQGVAAMYDSLGMGTRNYRTTGIMSVGDNNDQT